MEAKNKKKHHKVKSYVRYSGMAYQLFGLLALSIFLGLKADAYFSNEKKLITAVLSLVVLVAYFYRLTVELNKK